jgi:hypothetical protein
MGSFQDDGKKWVLARDAPALLRRYYPNDDQAKNRLIGWCRDEMIGSRCERLVHEIETTGRVYYDDVQLTAEFWDGFGGARATWDADWVGGVFSCHKYDPYDARSQRANGVEFCQDDIWQRIGLPPQESPAPPKIVHVSNTPSPISPIGSEVRLSDIDPSRFVRKAVAPPAMPTPRGGGKVRRPKASPVSQAEIDWWYSSLSADDQSRGHRDLYAEAKKHFRPRNVGKKLIDTITQGRRRGRPPKAKNVPGH